MTGVDLATTVNDVVRAQVAAGMEKMPLRRAQGILNELGLRPLGMRGEGAKGHWVAFLRAGRALIWYRSKWLDEDVSAIGVMCQVKDDIRVMGFENVSAFATTDERVEKFRSTRQWPHKPYLVDLKQESE